MRDGEMSNTFAIPRRKAYPFDAELFMARVIMNCLNGLSLLASRLAPCAG